MFAAVNAAHIKVIPILGNNWVDCDYIGARPSYCGSTSSGKGCTGTTCGNSWYDTGYTTPSDGYSVSYQAWATEVVSRYAGNPAIAAWEILNEPWGHCVHNFFVDMSTRIRAADPTTPISLGGSESGGWDFRAENSLPNVTWTTFHYYGHALEALPASEQTDLSIAAWLGKPFYVGENGIQASDLPDGACDTQERADLFTQKIAASFAAGAIGYMPWVFSYTQAAGSCSHNFGPSSPVMQIFRAF
jgi:endo-1,4-beta-mannosidase